VVQDIKEEKSWEETVENTQEPIPEEADTQESIPDAIESPVVEDVESQVEIIAPEETEPVVQEQPVEPINQEVQVEPETIIDAEASLDDTQIRRVSDIYIFTETLQAWNTWNGVSNLKDILSVLGYYRWELTPDFDEETRIALRNTLIAECNWPESTKWILWPQARSCINTIELPNQ